MDVPAGARIVDDPAELAEFFSDAPGAHIYALADLEPPFWEPSTWYRRGDAVVGIVRFPDGDGEGLTVYSVATRDAPGTLDLLAEVAPALPASTLITAPSGVAQAFRGVRELAWENVDHRYVLHGEVPPAAAAGVVPLGHEAVEDLQRLYSTEPGAAFFLPHMLDEETFVGVYEDGRLVAAAGTHVVSEAHQCAAIGAVFTLPSHRGRGLGAAITAGVVHRLGSRVATIGLNVTEENVAARTVYERLGFVQVHRYSEAEVV